MGKLEFKFSSSPGSNVSCKLCCTQPSMGQYNALLGILMTLYSVIGLGH